MYGLYRKWSNRKRKADLL